MYDVNYFFQKYFIMTSASMSLLEKMRVYLYQKHSVHYFMPVCTRMKRLSLSNKNCNIKYLRSSTYT